MFPSTQAPARVTVKATLRGTTRRFPVEEGCTFTAFEEQLKKLFSTTDSFVVTYEDSDRDVITVSSDIELAELFSYIKATSQPIARIFLTTAADTTVDRDVNIGQTVGTTHPETIPELGALVTGFSELLAAVNTCKDTLMDASTPRAPVIEARAAPHVAVGTLQRAPTSRKGLFAGLRPYMDSFPNGKMALRKNLKNVSPDVKQSFKKLVRYIVKSDDSMKIVTALKDAYPLLRTWANDLDGEDMPSMEKIDELIAAGEADLREKVGEEAANRIVEFVRLALADAAVVNMMRGFSGVETVPWEGSVEPALKKAKKSSRGLTRKSSSISGASGQETDGGKKVRPLTYLRKYVPAFPSGRAGFKQCVKGVSAESKTAFKQVARFVAKAPNRVAVIDALKDAYPTLREWMNEDMGDSGVPDVEKVDALLEKVTASLTPKIGEEDTGRIVGAMRTCLADEGAVNFLRKVREMGAMPWEDGFKMPGAKTRKGSKGFDVHQVTCGNCKVNPIVGNRFKCTTKEGFNLCAKCYEDENVDKAGMEFVECHYAWESSLGSAIVPPAPLMVGDRGPSVKFLHKVLTDVGFMNESMYGKRVGFFGKKTGGAVKQFQMEKGVQGCVSGIYDKVTEDKLADVVTESQNADGGHAAEGEMDVEQDEITPAQA